MNQNLNNWRNWRDLTAGILLVLLIDSLFLLPMMIGLDKDVMYFYKTTIFFLLFLLLPFMQFFI
jgi:hypothetical protein